jgi:nucleoside-diphosphate-sugar epimerase
LTDSEEKAKIRLDMNAAARLPLYSPPAEELKGIRDVEFIEMPGVIREKYQYFTQANIEKIRATGYQGPNFTLEQAVTDYVQNYLVPHRHLELSVDKNGELRFDVRGLP